jgi:hypothetical protein
MTNQDRLGLYVLLTLLAATVAAAANAAALLP